MKVETAAQDTSAPRGRPASGRPERVAEAALEVLAAEGSRGLTHRAVDRAAGLPAGSTSNCFRDRPALLLGALRRHAELDVPPEAGDGAPEALTRDQAVALLMAGVDHVLAPASRHLLVARYELVLESTRRPELRREFDAARERFVGLAETVLEAAGCDDPREHAVAIVALIDGMLLDRLLAAGSAMDRGAMERALARMLASC